MIHEINTLVKGLIRNEKKYVKLKESQTKKNKEVKKYVRDLLTDKKELQETIIDMNTQIKSLKSQEETLLHDLYKQQKIAKDSLRHLENLSDRYDAEKRELIMRMEKEKDDSLKKIE